MFLAELGQHPDLTVLRLPQQYGILSTGQCCSLTLRTGNGEGTDGCREMAQEKQILVILRVGRYENRPIRPSIHLCHVRCPCHVLRGEFWSRLLSANIGFTKNKNSQTFCLYRFFAGPGRQTELKVRVRFVPVCFAEADSLATWSGSTRYATFGVFVQSANQT
jgi:hypothetical protein